MVWVSRLYCETVFVTGIAKKGRVTIYYFFSHGQYFLENTFILLFNKEEFAKPFFRNKTRVQYDINSNITRHNYRILQDYRRMV